MDIELSQLSDESTNPSQKAHLMEIVIIHFACKEYLMIPISNKILFYKIF